MKLSEEAMQALWRLSEQPESVCYIEKHDREGFMVEEIDGDYCHACAEKKAMQLDSEAGGKYHYEVYEESLPENEEFSYCSECGCPLDATLIMSELAEDGIQDVVEELRTTKAFADIKGYLSWRICQLLGWNEKATYQLFPKQMNYIAGRLNHLYKKQKPKSIEGVRMPKTEFERLLEANNLYAEVQEPFEHRYLMIIRTADGKQVWSRRRADVQALRNDTIQFLRAYKKV
jgi:hypothetical protein